MSTDTSGVSRTCFSEMSNRPTNDGTMNRLLLGLRALRAIAVNTFREALRNKIFGALLLFAAAVIVFGIALGAMSVHNEVRVISDVSLFASTLFTMVITVYVSINLLQTEIDRRTIYTILSKPIRRWQFLLGKFLGIALLMVSIVALLYGLSAGLRYVQGAAPTPAFTWAFVLIYLQLLIVSAVALFFASFSSPLLSGLLTVGIFVLGHLHDQLTLVRSFFEARIVRRLIDAVAFVLPNLTSLNVATEVVHEFPLPIGYLAHAAWYALSYTVVVLVFAMMIFARRDLF